MSGAWLAARRKVIASALGTLVVAVIGATTGGLHGGELAMAIVAAVTTAVVYIVRNVPDAPDRDRGGLLDPVTDAIGLTDRDRP